MNKDFLSIVIGTVIISITAIASTTIYHINDRNNMSKNIEAAIAKGVDPLSVKCAYETQPNAVCITHSLVVSQPLITSIKK